MMKMKGSRLICILLLMARLAGCAGEKNADGATGHLNPKTPVTVTLWHYYVGDNQQALEEAVAAFNTQVGIDKGVIVDAVAMGSIAELEEQITASAKGVINALPMPQLFSSYPDKAMEIDGYGMVADLTEYLSVEEQNLYVADFLADGMFAGGRLLLLPVVKSTELLYVNATGWESFARERGHALEGLTTWESLYAAARDYYQWTDGMTPDTPGDGKALMGFDSVANYVIVGNRQLGTRVIDADSGEAGVAVLSREAMRRIFDLYYQGMSLGYFGGSGRFRSDDIKAGLLTAYVGSSSSAAYFPTWIEKDNTQSPIDFAALPYPVFEGGEPCAIQQGAGMCVAKSTPAQQEGAALFLKWFTEAEQNISFAMTTGYLPVRAGAYSMPEFSAALDVLRSGDKAGQNVAAVYEIALRQITESNTYAAKPFAGSYDVRSILQSTLIAAGEEGAALAAPLRQVGAAEADILALLDPDARFEVWLEAVCQAFDSREIAFTLS